MQRILGLLRRCFGEARSITWLFEMSLLVAAIAEDDKVVLSIVTEQTA